MRILFVLALIASVLSSCDDTEPISEVPELEFVSSDLMFDII